MKRYLSILLILFTAFAVAGSSVGANTVEITSSEQLYTAVQVSEEKEEEIILRDVPDSKYFDVKPPAIFSTHTETADGICEGDLYVSVKGDDASGDGSFEKPFATITRARDEIRKIKAIGGLPDGGITVAIMAGRYRISDTISFNSSDSGTEESPVVYTAYGDGEVIFTGNTELDASDFHEVGGDVKSILKGDAARDVRVADLKKYGITSDMLYLNPIGVHRGGSNAEFYFNRENYTLARYPNDNEFAYTLGLKDEGYGWGGAEFEMRAADAARVKTWKDIENAWVLGMFYYEYQDSTSPVTFDLNRNTFSGDLISVNHEHTPYRYFFYNVLDELDEPGEWYLDRENCLLYIYPNGDINEASLEFVSDFGDNFVNLRSCDHLTLKGLTFLGSRGGGIYARNVDYFSLLNCNFGELGGQAVSGYGSNSLIRDCEINYVGGGGISFGGGDKASLTMAYNVIDNNYVSHWGLNNRVFTTAIETSGQGNTISHNEICYSTSNSLGMSGNMNVVEYNLVHDCTNYANDCGSLYTGSSWTSGGSILRYNCFYNIGSDAVKPSAIYWDDGMAYQTAYGNLFVNISGYALSIGGGFGQNVINNIIINTGMSPFLYDDRPYVGNKAGDSFYSIGGFLWNLYKETPYKSEVWRENFPLLNQILQNNNDRFAPHYAYNPAFSLFSDNIYANSRGYGGAISVAYPTYSASIDNYACYLEDMDKVFVNPDAGDYRILEDSEVWDTVVDFEPIPYHKIGRY